MYGARKGSFTGSTIEAKKWRARWIIQKGLTLSDDYDLENNWKTPRTYILRIHGKMPYLSTWMADSYGVLM